MKNIEIYFAALAVILLLVFFFSNCDKDKMDPSAQTVDIEAIYSLRQLKNLTAPSRPYIFEEDAAVYAVVTMDEAQGNIYKQLYVQDSTDAILLVFNSPTNLKVGDSMRIKLKGTTVEISHDAHQISTLSASEHTAILARNRFIEPQSVTFEQINSGLFNLKLVKVDGVEFREEKAEEVWGDYLSFNTLNSMRNLFDCNEQVLKVLTSGHATFAAKRLPQDNGSMVVIASIYNGVMQLLVRNINEVDMRGVRCNGSGGDNTILSETFATGQGNFTVFNKIGENAWEYNITEKYMQMTKTNPPEPNEDWLISPAMDFSRITTEATLSFQHAIANLPGTVLPEYMITNQTAWLSFDYTSGNPDNALWMQIPLSDRDLPSGTNWISATASLTLPNSVFGKNKVHIAYKYICDEKESVTWRISNVLIKGK